MRFEKVLEGDFFCSQKPDQAEDPREYKQRNYGVREVTEGEEDSRDGSE